LFSERRPRPPAAKPPPRGSSSSSRRGPGHQRGAQSSGICCSPPERLPPRWARRARRASETGRRCRSTVPAAVRPRAADHEVFRGTLRSAKIRPVPRARGRSRGGPRGASARSAQRATLEADLGPRSPRPPRRSALSVVDLPAGRCVRASETTSPSPGARRLTPCSTWLRPLDGVDVRQLKHHGFLAEVHGLHLAVGARTAAGVPSAITRPWWRTMIRLGHREDDVHVVLGEQAR